MDFKLLHLFVWILVERGDCVGHITGDDQFLSGRHVKILHDAMKRCINKYPEEYCLERFFNSDFFWNK